MIKQGDLIEYVAEWQSAGSTAGKVDGLTVFVDQTLAGEKALVRVTHVNAKKGVAYGVVKDVLVPSPDRITPPCPYYQKCGGCTMQHMSYGAELSAKAQKVQNNLRKLAGIDVNVTVNPSPNVYGYRNKFSLPAGTKNGKLVLGMYQKDTHKVVALTKCMLGGDWADKVIKLFCDYANESGLTAYDETTFSGEIRHVVARFTSGQLLVTVVTTSHCKHDFTPFGKILSREFDGKAGLFVNVNDGKNNVILGKKTTHVCGISQISGENDGIKFCLKPQSFFQVNDQVKRMLYAHAKSLLDTSGTEVLVDLFSGIGILTLAMSTERYHTYAVEIEPSAVSDANKMLELNGIKTVTNVCGDAERELPVIVEKCAGKKMSLVVDPPRKGLGEKVCQTICNAGFDNVVYVSCDSATLARDLKLLGDNYTLTSATCYDMFPRTDNVETVVSLVRKTDHQMKLNPEPFAMVKSRQKTIELRLFDDKRQKIKVGDTVVFTQTETGEKLYAKVKNLHTFSNFTELYKVLPLLKCGYTAQNVATATPSDMEKYYSPAEQSQFGVVGIEIEVINN